MSSKLPRLAFGMRVRVMQTTEMDAIRLANRRGTVMEKPRTPNHLVRVALDETDTEHELNVELSVASLMPETAPDEPEEKADE